MTAGGAARRDSSGRELYYDGSEHNADRRLSSNERQIYNTFSSNYFKATHRTFGASATLLNQQVNMTKMMLMSQKKMKGK